MTLGGGAGPLVFTTPPTHRPGTANSLVQFQLGFNWDTDAPKISATSGIYPSRRSLHGHAFDRPVEAQGQRGGKMILYHGLSDPVFSFKYTPAGSSSLSATPGNGTVKDFVRLFAVPGMNHCSGGPATDSFPIFTSW